MHRWTCKSLPENIQTSGTHFIPQSLQKGEPLEHKTSWAPIRSPAACWDEHPGEPSWASTLCHRPPWHLTSNTGKEQGKHNRVLRLVWAHQCRRQDATNSEHNSRGFSALLSHRLFICQGLYSTFPAIHDPCSDKQHLQTQKKVYICVSRSSRNSAQLKVVLSKAEPRGRGWLLGFTCCSEQGNVFPVIAGEGREKQEVIKPSEGTADTSGSQVFG